MKKQMEVKEFLGIESLNYDFTDDCDYTKDSNYKNMNGYAKYFAYKTLDAVKDPDSYSILLQEIYKLLWPELEQKDFMMGKDGKIYCLEANTLPGMTPTSLLPQEAAALGMDFPSLCEHLIQVSLR